MNHTTEASADTGAADTALTVPDLPGIDPEDAALFPRLFEVLATGGTLGQACGMTSEDFEGLYAVGYGLYQQGRYADAFRIFGLLVTQNHLEPRFLMAFAGCHQKLGHYQAAIDTYSIASLLDLDDPKPTLRTCECLIAMGRLGEALDGLELLLADCKPGRHDGIQRKAEGLIALLRGRGITPQEGSQE